MKGEVLITITDKNGKVKRQIKEHNTVFDLPKEIIKELLSEANLGTLGSDGYNMPGSSASAYGISSPIGNVSCYAEWFRCIKINDETCSVTDFKDWKLPVLTGGEYSKHISANKRYTYIDTTRSSKAGKIMKKYYTWTDCPSFTLRSINLCHVSNCQTFGIANSIFNCFKEFSNSQYLRKKGKYYFSGANCKNADYFNQDYYSILGTLSANGFTWDKPSAGASSEYTEGGVDIDKLNCCYNYYGGNSMTLKTPLIFALKNDANDYEELLVFRKSDDMETNDTSQYWEYVKIIDANTGTEKRSFRYNKFQNISYSQGYGVNYQWINVVATDFGTFLVQSTINSYSSGNVNIWKIPETQTDEIIPLYATISETAFRPGDNIIVINNYMINLYQGNAVRINNDVNEPYTFYNYLPFNYYNLQQSSYHHMAYFNKYYKITRSKYNFETWYNTTVLNLSSPVEVAAGDTLNIEYTITAS